MLEHTVATTDAPQLPRADVVKLVEELRVYQVELELQNEELRRAQLDANMARRRYEALFQQTPMMAMVVDAQGMVEEANVCAQAWLKSRQEGVGQLRFWRGLGSDDRVRFFSALRDLPLGASDVVTGLRLEGADGKGVWDAHVLGLSLDYKLDRRILVLLVDRSAQAAREAEQRFYNALIDASDNFLYATDSQGRVLMVNQVMLDFFGHKRAAVIGQPRTELLPLREALVHQSADSRVMTTGTAFTLEQQVYTRQGQARSYVCRKFPLTDAAGLVYGVGGIATDITEFKAAERLARLSEMVFQNSQEAIIITDPETRILRVNPAFSHQSGFSAETVIGQTPRVLKSGRQSVAFYQALWAKLAQEGRWAGEICNRRADGSYYTVWCQINAVHDEQGELTHYIGTQVDVSPLHDLNAKLQHQATVDTLTGLPNRALMLDRLNQMLASAARTGQPFALLFVDLDEFKAVNDSLGHAVGDRLLRTVAERMTSAVRSQDTVARIGGDEFVVLLPGADRAVAGRLANAMLELLHRAVQLDDNEVAPRASVGVAVHPEDGKEADLLLRHADMAMYASKVQGRDRVTVFDDDMAHANDAAFALQNALSRAIPAGELRVHYQPQVDLRSGKLVGVEALVRWQHPERGLLAPAYFISLAEHAGLLAELDAWVLNEVLRQISAWHTAGLWPKDLSVAVNQNAVDLQRQDFVPRLRQALADRALPPSVLELEITEDTLMQHTDEQHRRLQDLKAMGVRLSIDDFGTGYSSLGYLRQLPLNVLKIDQTFVRGMLANDADRILVHTIIDMAHRLGLTLIAEGIELEAQRELLRSLKCENGQGYLFARPLDAATFAKQWLAAGNVSKD